MWVLLPGGRILVVFLWWASNPFGSQLSTLTGPESHGRLGTMSCISPRDILSHWPRLSLQTQNNSIRFTLCMSWVYDQGSATNADISFLSTKTCLRIWNKRIIHVGTKNFINNRTHLHFFCLKCKLYQANYNLLMNFKVIIRCICYFIHSCQF